MSGPGQRTVVIGGGISGLATACLLARDGQSVTLLERNAPLGGRAGTWSAEGFTFDTGPSWYLMPEVFEHFYALMGTSADAELDLVTLDPAYRVYSEGDREPIVIAADLEENVATFERVEPGSGAALTTYLESARETYELALRWFLYNPFSSGRSLAAPAVIRRLPQLAGFLSRSLDRHIRRSFDDVRLRQILGYPAVFLGTSPFDAPSMYHLMSHMDLTGGVQYPRGGFGTVVDSLVRLAERHGVRVLTETDATRIVSVAGAVDRVEYRDAAGATGRIDADIVVSTVDGRHTEMDLLEPADRSYRPSRWERQVSGPSAVLLMLGVRGELPELDHHTLFFARDWDANFSSIFGPNPGIPDPPSLYVCKPSATDPAVAPDGHENLFVLVPVPADPATGHGGVGGAGSEIVERVADDAIAQIASWAGIEDLADRVVVRRTIGPTDFETRFNAFRGSALGPAHILSQSAFMRGVTRSKRVKHLYYAGATTVPGVGLPMCLISAELVLKHIRGDRSPGRSEVAA